jgi:predicted kinase
LRLTLDEWMTRLFRPDRPQTRVMEWYVERADRCIDQIWSVTASALEVGTDVVLEIGLIRRHDRDAFYERVDAAAVALSVYLVDAPREIRRERVARRNVEQGDTFAMDVPPEFFELASDLWEPPTDVECAERRIRVIGA